MWRAVDIYLVFTPLGLTIYSLICSLIVCDITAVTGKQMHNKRPSVCNPMRLKIPLEHKMVRVSLVFVST